MEQIIGMRIKSLRVERGLTLAGLGALSKLSPGFLSQVERGKSTPSIATLAIIAQALDVAPRSFFEDDRESVYIVDSGAEAVDDHDSLPRGYRPLSPILESNRLSVILVTVQPRESSGPLRVLSGEEIIFVLAGKLEIVIGDESHRLEAGDSIHLDAGLPRQWTNASDALCTMLWGRVGSRLDFGIRRGRGGIGKKGAADRAEVESFYPTV